MSKLWWISSQALLQNLKLSERNDLFKLTELTSYEENSVVFSSDLPTDVLYFIQEGCINVLQKTSVGTIRLLSTLEKGDCFGMLGLVELGQKDVYAKTAAASHVLVLRKPAFEKIIKYSPKLSTKLVSTLKHVLGQQEQEQRLEEYQSSHLRFNRLIEAYAENPHFKIGERQIDLNYQPEEFVQLIHTSENAIKSCMDKLLQEQIVTLKQKVIKRVC